jgi:cysteine desulfurase
MIGSDIIYLDYAAATPLDPRVFAAMEPYFTTKFYNPSSPYEPARAVRRDINAARAQLAQVIGGKPDEIIMTAGATESINIAFHGVMFDGGHVVTSEIEHPAVTNAAKAHDYTLVKPTEKGVITPEVVAAAIRDDTRLVSVAIANNELGTIQPMRDIAAVIEKAREVRRTTGNTTPLYFHSDASQGAGVLSLNVARLGLDLLTLNAGKCYGPKQVGLLWSNSEVRLRPFILGGGQESGIRSGTENVVGIIGFGEALTIAEAMRAKEVKRLSNLRNALQKKLESAFDDMEVSGYQKRRLPGLLHATWPGLDAERVLFALEMRGIMVATGSACAANKGTRSHVLTAIGMSPHRADGSLRFSLGRHTTELEIEKAATEIITVIREEKAR